MANKKKVYEPKTFTLTAEQVEKFEKWVENKNKKDGEVYVGAVGGAYTFCFTPTGIGTIEEVRCADGTSLDLSEFDTW